MIEIFKKFPKILRTEKSYCCITQKLHGTNAQIFVDGNMVVASSRSRSLTTNDDNYGFANFVENNKEEIIEKLGNGRHYGEWVGNGINNGEGFKDRRLFLFNHHYFQYKELPNNCYVIPVITKFMGIENIANEINQAMDLLNSTGSLACPGFKTPEGIVIEIDGLRFKKTFDNEETPWRSVKRITSSKAGQLDVSYLLQPLRLKKILGGDERMIMDFPKTIPDICKIYIKDLEDEGCFDCYLEKNIDIRVVKKALGKHIYIFIKQIAEQYYSNNNSIS